MKKEENRGGQSKSLRERETEPIAGAERHFELEEWREALAGGGLGPSRQARLIEHFSAPCAVCWLGLEEAGRELPPDSWAPTRSAPELDLVSSALYRWSITRGGSDQACRELDLLSPAHREAVTRARDWTLGFARLVLEEARKVAFEDAGRARASAEQGREILRLARLDKMAPHHSQDLEALATAYLADAHTVNDEQLEAENLFAIARQTLACGSDSPEIRALVDELRSELLGAQGRYTEALRVLGEVEKMMEIEGTPGHRSEILGRQGGLLLEQGNEPRAFEKLRKALAVLPRGQSPRLRLSLLHNLTVAEVRLGRIEEARRHLEDAGPLYETHGTSLLRAQRYWTSGRIAMRARDFERAESDLRTAFQRLLELQIFFETLWRDPRVQPVLEAEGRRFLFLIRESPPTAYRRSGIQFRISCGYHTPRGGFSAIWRFAGRVTRSSIRDLTAPIE